MRGVLGFSVLWIWPIFRFGFSVFALKKLWFFDFGVLLGLRVFFNLVSGFRFFLSNAFYGFSGFANRHAKEVQVHPAAALKLQFQGATYIRSHI